MRPPRVAFRAAPLPLPPALDHTSVDEDDLPPRPWAAVFDLGRPRPPTDDGAEGPPCVPVISVGSVYVVTESSRCEREKEGEKGREARGGGLAVVPLPTFSPLSCFSSPPPDADSPDLVSRLRATHYRGLARTGLGEQGALKVRGKRRRG